MKRLLLTLAPMLTSSLKTGVASFASIDLHRNPIPQGSQFPRNDQRLVQHQNLPIIKRDETAQSVEVSFPYENHRAWIADYTHQLLQTADIKQEDQVILALPVGTTFIDKKAFYECKQLVQIIIPTSVTQIRSCAFSGCSGLTQITLPSSVTSITREAFSGCSRLATITLPANVLFRGGWPFLSCQDLRTIIITNLDAGKEVPLYLHDQLTVRGFTLAAPAPDRENADNAVADNTVVYTKQEQLEPLI